MQSPPSFPELVQRSTKPIGTIARSLEFQLNLAPSEHWPSVIAEYDAAFGHRHDYRIWRALCREFRRRSASIAIPAPQNPELTSGNVFEDISARLTSSTHEEAWGIIGLIAWTDFQRAHIEAAPALVVAIHEHPALTSCPAGCAIARAIASTKVLRWLVSADEDAATHRTLVQRHIDLLDSLLRVIDWRFRVGYALSFDASRTEQEVYHLRVIPEDPVSDTLRNFADALLDCQKLSRDSGLGEGADDQSLREANAIFHLSYVAWRTRRLSRLDYRKLLDLPSTDAATFERIYDNIYDSEMNALRSTAYAAVLAREFILAAGFWWTYQTLYAKRNKPLNGSVPGWSHRRIREAGLGVDESYSNRTEGTPTQPSNASTARPFSKLAPVPAPRAATLDRILEQHRSAHPNIWASLEGLLEEGSGPGYLERALRNLAEAYDKGRRIPDQAAIKSLLLIALDVDFLRTAIDMLRRVDQPGPFLVPIALRIGESTRLNRLALSSRRLSGWLTAIKDRWNICATDSLTDEERFSLHEVLLGRHATIRGTLRPRAAELLLNRVFNPDALVPADYFDVIEQHEDAFRPGPDLIPPRDLAGFVARHQDYPMGSPLVVSLVTLSSGTSVITHGLRTGLRGLFRPDLNLAAEFEVLIKQRNYWFKWRRGNSSNHVPWGDNAFIALRNDLVELARENGAKWIMLATEPRLSALPWQHLFAYSAGYSRLSDSPLLVTIVPNMGWAPLLDRQPYHGVPGLVELVCRSNDRVIERGRAVLDELKAIHPTPPFNLGVILGHGYWPENAGRLPEIIVSNRTLEAEDWLEVATCQVIVLHSCWSGTAAQATQWAEGALVVHLLGPCRAVVAPVGEIPVIAMRAMHREFMVGGSSGTLGERYLRALTAEPSVSLYTVFGLGSVPPFAV